MPRKFQSIQSTFFSLILSLCTPIYATWSEPITLYSGIIGVDPVTGIAQDGKALVLFMARDNFSMDLYRKAISLNRAAPIGYKDFVLHQSEYSGAAPHSIAMNENGEAIASWLDRREGAPALFASIFSNQAWSEDQMMSSGEAYRNQAPFSIIDDLGNRRVVWVLNANESDRINSIQTASLAAGNADWGGSMPIVPSDHFIETSIGNAQFASSSLGYYSMFWGSMPPKVYGMQFFGTVFQKSIGSLEVQEGNSIAMATAINRNGSLLLFAWNSPNGIALGRFSETGSLDSPIFPISTLNRSISKITATIDDQNRAMIIFSKEDRETEEAQLIAIFYANNEWSEQFELDRNFEAFDQVEQKSDNAGNRYVVWGKKNELSGLTSIYANRYDVATGLWEALPFRLSSEEVNASRPSLSVNNGGDALVAWSIGTGIQIASTFQSAPEESVTIKKYVGRVSRLKKRQRRYTLHMKWKIKTNSDSNSTSSYAIYQNETPIANINSLDRSKFHVKLPTNHHFHNELLRKKYKRRLEKRYSIVALNADETIQSQKGMTINQ
ncbi:MAG: hypothetical protein QRY74_00370 [Chlamydia sp.]